MSQSKDEEEEQLHILFDALTTNSISSQIYQLEKISIFISIQIRQSEKKYISNSVYLNLQASYPQLNMKLQNLQVCRYQRIFF
jgi:hypothetical protein